MEIEAIITIEQGRLQFRGTWAVVVTKDGRRFQYAFEYNPQTWKDLDDYLDNVKTDFESESAAQDFAQGDDGLFWELHEGGEPE